MAISDIMLTICELQQRDVQLVDSGGGRGLHGATILLIILSLLIHLRSTQSFGREGH
jgi:hypothetical protein